MQILVLGSIMAELVPAGRVVRIQGRELMFGTMSVEDFDQRVKSILVQEFVGVLELGLLSEEALLPVVSGMRNSLCEAFFSMSTAEAEFHLQAPRDQCREAACSIVALADSGYWN